MAITKIGQAYFAADRAFTKGLKKQKFVCDTEADVANLPKCDPGSCAIVADGGPVYMVNASGNWSRFAESGSSTAVALAMAEGVSF